VVNADNPEFQLLAKIDRIWPYYDKLVIVLSRDFQHIDMMVIIISIFITSKVRFTTRLTATSEGINSDNFARTVIS
jgi:hypothetical protein